jgi:hypothetical protein
VNDSAEEKQLRAFTGMRKNYRTLLLILAIVLIAATSTGCSIARAFQPTPTATSTTTPNPTATIVPPTSTPTEVPVFADAVYFTGDLQVPILIYHRFYPDHFGPNTAVKMQLSEFSRELQAFYDNGFSLISLKSWIDGTFIVPPGRKPLILTIDDVWQGDTLFIQPDGTPSPLSGIGLIWEFSQAHPDFGFHVAVFSVMGDKYFPDKQVGDRFLISDGQDWNSKLWRQALGNTIAWALDNGVEVYNHTLVHFDLSEKPDSVITPQLWGNDQVTRERLTEVGREDLIPSLDNVIALPEGKWPSTESGKQLILRYINPEGKPVMAVMEAYNLDAKQFTPSFFSENFNPYAIPRITASAMMTDFIVDNKELVPSAKTCVLGPMREGEQTNKDILSGLILNEIDSGECAEGVYHVNGFIFMIQDGTVTVHSIPEG